MKIEIDENGGLVVPVALQACGRRKNDDQIAAPCWAAVAVAHGPGRWTLEDVAALEATLCDGCKEVLA